MGFARQMRGAEDAELLPLEVMQALGEVDTLCALLRVRAAFGRRAQKAVGLHPPCYVRTCLLGRADDTVVLESPWCVRTLTTTTFHTVRLPPPMLANPL